MTCFVTAVIQNVSLALYKDKFSDHSDLVFFVLFNVCMRAICCYQQENHYCGDIFPLKAPVKLRTLIMELFVVEFNFKSQVNKLCAR